MAGQDEVLAFISGCISRYSYAPTYQEIADHFGFTQGNAMGHVERLQVSGKLKITRNTARGIKLTEKKGVNQMTDWQTKFNEFHSNNPHIFDELVKLALALKERGHNQYSIQGLFEVLRYRKAIKTADSHSQYKLNNNYKPYYARMIMQRFAFFKGFFELREMK